MEFIEKKKEKLKDQAQFSEELKIHLPPFGIYLHYNKRVYQENCLADAVVLEYFEIKGIE